MRDELAGTAEKRKSPGTHATKATKPGFVGFVACPHGPLQKTEREAQPQPTPAPEPPKPGPRLSWGHYTPANAAEIARMLERVQRGAALGLSERESDELADLLHLRDREGDDRHVCIECQHIRASGTGWRCAARGPIPPELVATQPQRCAEFKGVSRD
jgi:hypothetical protein